MTKLHSHTSTVARGNYGWKIMEGTACFSPSSNCDPTNLELPVWDYGRSIGTSVTGGFVYRGNRVPELFGAYVYADFVSGRIWSLRYDGENPPANNELLDTNLNISSFGVDAAQNLYICAFDGRVYRFVATAPSAPTAVATEQTVLPSQFALTQNYPNPFNCTTFIRFSLPYGGPTDLSLYNLAGQKIATLTSGHLSAGTHAIAWHGTDTNGTRLASGAYLYRLRFGNEVQSHKLILLQ